MGFSICKHIYKHLSFPRMLEVRMIQSWLPNFCGNRILDIGCGDGYWTTRLANSFKSQAYGIDLNPRAVEKAGRYSGTRCNFLVASADNLPFSENAFDIVISLSAFQFFQDGAQVLREIQRVLRVNGVLILTCDAMDYRRISRRFLQLHQNKYHPVRYYSRDRLVSEIQNSGFRVLKTDRLIHSPIASYIMYFVELFGKITYIAAPLICPLVILSDKMWSAEAGGHTVGIIAINTNDNSRVTSKQ